jgi:hypothetical protein
MAPQTWTRQRRLALTVALWPSHPAAPRAEAIRRSVQIENQLQRVVDAPHLVQRQARDLFPERPRIHGSHHLAHHPRRLVADYNVGMKACCRSRGRCGVDDDRREREKIVRPRHERAPRKFAVPGAVNSVGEPVTKTPAPSGYALQARTALAPR